MIVMGWLYRLTRWTVGSIFIYAGTAKLLDPRIFAVLIDAFGLLPGPLMMPVAIALPILEVLAGVGLLFDIRWSLSVISALLILFIAILGYGIWMGLDVDCGCYGPQDPEAKAFHSLRTALYRDMAMLLGIAFIAAWRRYRNVQPKTINLNRILLWKKGRREDAYG